MNYNWTRINLFTTIKTSIDDNDIFVRTDLMHPYGHLYIKIEKEGKSIVEMTLKEDILELHLTHGDYTSENAKSIEINSIDYFECMTKILAYENYFLSKELYDDLFYIREKCKETYYPDLDNLVKS